MKKLILVITLISFSVLACKTNKKDKAIKIEESQDLENRVWQLLSLVNENETIKAKQFQRIPEINFSVSEMKISGNDGCNRMFGKIESIESNRISFGSIGGTKKYCPQTMQLTKAFLKALKLTYNYKISENKLSFFNENNELLLVFE